MVVNSRIHTDVKYDSSNKLDENDLGFEADNVYEYLFEGIPIEFVLGNVNENPTYQIRYYYVYIVDNNYDVCSKIGIFEMKMGDVIKKYDEENGCFDIENENLIFIVNKEYIQKIVEKFSQNIDKNLEEKFSQNIEENLEGKFSQNIEENLEGKFSQNIDKNLEEKFSQNIEEKFSKKTDKNIEEKFSKKTEENIEENLEEKFWEKNPNYIELPEIPEYVEEIDNNYKDSLHKLWIQRFMKNDGYDIINTGNSNDCFFEVIRFSFEEIGRIITIEKLRKILSNHITEKEYEYYREHRNILRNQQNYIKDESKKTKKEILQIKKTLEQNKDNYTKDETKKQISYAKELATKYNTTLSTNKIVSKEYNQSKFIENIDTFEKFKEVLNDIHYCPDKITIPIIEKLLNIKIILFSQQSYEEADYDSVIVCGNTSSQDDIFNPEYYIFVNNIDNCYHLITYRKRKIFKFKEIPYGIKMMLINKCMEKNAGPFYLIEDFRNYQKKMKINPDIGEPIPNDEYERFNNGYYNINTVFVFHKNSANSPLPGRGQGEHIEDYVLFDIENKYLYLANIVNWRRKLDDSWKTLFVLDGKKWNTVEHYILGSQFKNGFPDYYHKFSIDSGSGISKDLKLAHEAVKPDVLKMEKIEIDNDYYDISKPRKNEERENAVRCKFEQNLDLCDILLKTGDALLMKYHRGKPVEPDILLMKVRKDIGNNSGLIG